MTRNLKTLGLGLMMALAMSAFLALGAAADPTKHTGGHFTQDSGGRATLHGSFGGGHQMHLTMFGSAVGCIETVKSEMTAPTQTEISLFIEGTVCGSKPTILMNGCTYTLTVRDTDASTKLSSVHLKCPIGKKVEMIQHGSCTVTLGEQTFTEGATYTKITVNGKHALTVDMTLNTIYEKHGSCEFMPPFGTGPHSGAGGISLTGSMTLIATGPDGNPANLTATGSNGH